jgi:hypothetical protein
MQSSLRRSYEANPSDSVQAVYESLKTPLHQQEKRQVLEAIRSLNFVVTPGDVAQETGLPVLKSTALLNQVAHETGGNLEVGTTGDVTYKFIPGFETRYLLNGANNFARTVFRVVCNCTIAVARALTVLSIALFRIGIGVVLICSVVLVVVLIVAVIVAAIAKLFGDNNDSGGDGLFDMGAIDFSWLGGLRFWMFDWLWDWSWWHMSGRPTYSWWNFCDPRRDDPFWPLDDFMYQDRSPSIVDTAAKAAPEQTTKDAEADFVDNCCAVVFGAPDPNQQLLAAKWQIIARVIKGKQGVIIAADLMPYLDTTDTKNEDWMLPILIRFNGSPEVSENGNLIYVFPSFVPRVAPQNSQPIAPQVQASTSTESDDLSALVNRHRHRIQTKQVAAQAAHEAQSLPRFLEEQEIPLNGFEMEFVNVYLFAGFTSGGSLTLLNMAHQYSFLLPFQPVLYGIAAYGGIFLAAPLLRCPFVAAANTRICDRNQRRQEAAERLAYPDAELKGRLQDADVVRHSVCKEDAGIVYSTEYDALEQRFH